MCWKNTKRYEGLLYQVNIGPFDDVRKIHAELVRLPTRSSNPETSPSSDIDRAAEAIEELSLSGRGSNHFKGALAE